MEVDSVLRVVERPRTLNAVGVHKSAIQTHIRSICRRLGGGIMKLALFNDFRPGLVSDDRMIDLSDLVGPDIMGLRARDRMPALIAKLVEGEIAFDEAAEREGIPLADI